MAKKTQDVSDRVVMGPGPYSSPDPRTDGYRQIPRHSTLGDDTTAAEDGEPLVSNGGGTEGEDGIVATYASLEMPELHVLAKDRDLTVEGTGKNGAVKKVDLVSALEADDKVAVNAEAFRQKVEQATTQDELDAIATEYDEQGVEYASVVEAVEAKQVEIDAAAAESGEEKEGDS